MQSFLRKMEEFTFFRGRVALYALLQGLGVGKGDTVAIQAFTCVAVPEAIFATGARPVYVDIESTGFNMDAGDLACKITPQTKAIIVQHTFGIPADMERIKHVADKKNIPIIEDCCHALVSTYKGEAVGSFGAGSFYSFEWGKPIVAGIGGSAIINESNLKKKVKSQYENYRFPSIMKLTRIQFQYFGFKVLYRPSLYWTVRDMFRLLGAIGASVSNYNVVQEHEIAEDFRLRMSKRLKKRVMFKLSRLDEWTRHSRWVAAEYRSKIKTNVVSHPILPDNSDIVFVRYPLITENKEALLQYARKANVELADWYSTPIHPLASKDLEAVYYEAGSCPNAEKRCKEVITLPTHAVITNRDIDRTEKFLMEFVV